MLLYSIVELKLRLHLVRFSSSDLYQRASNGFEIKELIRGTSARSHASKYEKVHIENRRKYARVINGP